MSRHCVPKRSISTTRYLGLLIVLCTLLGAPWCSWGELWSDNPSISLSQLTVVVSDDRACVELHSGPYRIDCTWAVPETTPVGPGAGDWTYTGRRSASGVLAGRIGRFTYDFFTAGGLDVTRQIWQADDENFWAVRQTVANGTGETIRLHKLTPLTCVGADALSCATAPTDRWRILVHPREKLDQPQSLWAHNLQKKEALADPFFLIRGGDESVPTMLVGHLGQLGPGGRIRLKFSGSSDEPAFEGLWAQSEFDGCELPPGGERTSHWVVVSFAQDPVDLLADFVDRIGDHHGVSKPAAVAPSVLCTWYYYGTNFSEAYFREDIAQLARRPVPFDVYLIDDCWSQSWGDWVANDKFSSGMKFAVDQIKQLGYQAGIWTAPFLVDADSDLAKRHTDWLLRDRQGELVIFPSKRGVLYILDPTFPGVCAHIAEVHRRLREDCGFDYFKTDFMRAVPRATTARLYDDSATLVEAYRRGLAAVRCGIGPQAYLSVCGGHYGGSLGLADSQRSGRDTKGFWREKNERSYGQNALRTWMSRLWHVDPDAMAIRLQAESVPGFTGEGAELCLGSFTDIEAMTVAMNQYVGGGLVCLAERFQELSPQRYALLRHTIPSVDAPSAPLDVFEQPRPSQMLTHVVPVSDNLSPWVTVTVFNWQAESQIKTVTLSERVCASLDADRFVVFDFAKQEVLGVFTAGATVDLGFLPGHGATVLRIVGWNGGTAVLAGTDLHFSGGGVEVAAWQGQADRASGWIATDWKFPVTVTAVFPTSDGYVVGRDTVERGTGAFNITMPTHELSNRR